MTTGTLPGITDPSKLASLSFLVDGVKTAEDLKAATGFLAGSTDKEGVLTIDEIVYLNQILGIPGTITGSDGKTYVDFSSFTYDRQTVYGSLTAQVLVETSPGVFTVQTVNLYDTSLAERRTPERAWMASRSLRTMPVPCSFISTTTNRADRHEKRRSGDMKKFSRPAPRAFISARRWRSGLLACLLPPHPPSQPKAGRAGSRQMPAASTIPAATVMIRATVTKAAPSIRAAAAAVRAKTTIPVMAKVTKAAMAEKVARRRAAARAVPATIRMVADTVAA